MRDAIIGDAPVKVAVEAAIRQGWDEIIGSDGAFVGMTAFGASAPYKDLYKHFGITPEAVAEAALRKLAGIKQRPQRCALSMHKKSRWPTCRFRSTGLSVFVGFGRNRDVPARHRRASRHDIKVIAINDLGPVETNAHLLRFDSVHGRFPGEVTVKGDTIDCGIGPIKGNRRCATRHNSPGRNSASTSRSNAPACSPPRKRPRRISRPAPSAC